MTPRVFDFDGTERDWAWLLANYGNVVHIEAAAGRAFRLAELHITHGPSVIQVQVRDEAGAPLDRQPVANTWPGIVVDSDHGNVDLRADPGLQSVYAPIACVQWTNSNGDTGYGIGGGSVIHEAGPHTVWVLSPSYPSDAAAGLGWLGGTEHWGPLRPVFELDLSETPPPVEPPPTGDLLAAVTRIADALEAFNAHIGVPHG